MSELRRLPNRMLFLGLFGVMCAVVVGRPVIESLCETPHPATTPVIKLPPTPEQIAKPHLLRAGQESEKAVDEYLESLDKFFSDSKKNTRGFAEEALGWGSKWRLIADHVPFNSGGQHEKFVRLKFEEYLFSPPQ